MSSLCRIGFISALWGLMAGPLLAQELPQARSPSETIEGVLIRPIFDEYYACTEHWAGQLPSLGDALGTDCVIYRLVEESGRTWMQAYRNQGRNNSDWFGWRQDVYAPISGKVVKVNLKNAVNLPGIMGSGPASFVILRAEDGTHVLLAHLREIQVKAGDQVVAGQVLARVGNNGFSRHPHVHLGAWRDQRPLQIRFDQRFMQPRQNKKPSDAAAEKMSSVDTEPR